jgi:FkbM family methyltransferase
MIKQRIENTYTFYKNLLETYKKDDLPVAHFNFLKKMKYEFNFEPKVCYDIGACVLFWTRKANEVWPDSEIVLFDAYEPAEIFYKNHKYHIGVLSNEDNKEVKFYQHDYLIAGNSYYKENTRVYTDDMGVVKKTRTLDSVIKEKNLPLPDLIKIDVQGAELDILNGAELALSNCKYLIVELQSVQYNLGAPLAPTTIKYLEDKGWECIARKFSDNGPDADYCFVNTNKFTHQPISQIVGKLNV